MSKKLVTDRSLDELLDTLDDVEAPEGDQIYDEMLLFIAEYNLSHGTDEVSVNILHKLYKHRFNSLMTRRSFTLRMKEYFDFRLVPPKGCKFKINRSAFYLSNESYKLLQNKKTKIFTHVKLKNQYEKFMLECNLQKGKYFVPSYVIYFMYDEWCFNKKKPKRISGRSFSDFSKLYFERKNPVLGEIHYFGIDYDKVKNYLTPERMEIINNWGSKIYGTKCKKTNKTIKKKISST